LDDLSKLPDFTATSIKEYIHRFADQHQLKANQVMMATRYIVTGTRVGAGVAETMEVLGRDTCLRRLQEQISRQAQ
jgi:glutamyl-tRNA synthetase